MSFKPFNIERRYNLKNEIKLRADGRIFISDFILNNIFGGRPSGLNFLIDEERNLLGVKLLNNFLSHHPSSIKPCYEKTGISFPIKQILKYFKLTTKRTSFEVHQEDGLVLIDLNKLKDG